MSDDGVLPEWVPEELHGLDGHFALGQKMAQAMAESFKDQKIDMTVEDGYIRMTILGGFDFYFLQNEDGTWRFDGWGMAISN